MSDRDYIKVNSSIRTASSLPVQNALGDYEARIELRLPENMIDPSKKVKEVKLQLSKMKVSLDKLPISSIPIDRIESGNRIITKGRLVLWPFKISRRGVEPQTFRSGQPFDATISGRNFITTDKIVEVEVPDGQLPPSSNSLYYNEISKTRVYDFDTPEEVCNFLSYAHDVCLSRMYKFCSYNTKMAMGNNDFKIYLDTATDLNSYAVLFGAPVSKSIFSSYDSASFYNIPVYNRGFQPSNWDPTAMYMEAYPYSIVVNKYIKQLLPFLPWREYDSSMLRGGNRIGNIDEGGSYEDGWKLMNFGDSTMFVLDMENCVVNVHDLVRTNRGDYNNGTREQFTQSSIIEYTFSNIVTTQISPVQSIVVMIEGMNVITQKHPINITSYQGSSLTTSVPILELYYPVPTSLASLHDELLIVKENFENAATTSVSVDSLKERTLIFSIGYITKNGELKKLYIPKEGTYAIQLTFGLYY